MSLGAKTLDKPISMKALVTARGFLLITIYLCLTLVVFFSMRYGRVGQYAQRGKLPTSRESCFAAISTSLRVNVTFPNIPNSLVDGSNGCTSCVPQPLLYHQKTSTAFLHRPRVAAHIECGKVLAGDTSYISSLTCPLHTPSQSRPTCNDESTCMETTCEAIRSRHYFSSQPLSATEAAWPWAQLRVVYRDYALIESELVSSYAPQNWYCYAVDAKAEALFRERIHALATCFPNVVVVPVEEEVSVDSAGHGTFPAMLSCMRMLAVEGRAWKYVALLQNHDVQIKTNAEMVQILQLLNGANEVGMGPPPYERYDSSLDWSLGALEIFRDPRRYYSNSNGSISPSTQLPLSYGLVQSMLSRPMVDFILNELNLTEFIRRQEQIPYGVDEQYIATLNAADVLGAPGGFTRRCIEGYSQSTQSITRLTVWEPDPCPAGYYRHGICVFSMEDLARLDGAVELYANKMLSEWDYGALVCWRERMFNRTYGGDPKMREEQLSGLSVDCYKSLPQVLFQSYKQGNNHVAGVKPAEADLICHSRCRTPISNATSELTRKKA